MMRRLLTITIFLIRCFTLYAGPTDGKDAAKTALEAIDKQIALEQMNGNVREESEARWRKMVTLKNYSMTENQIQEAEVQMQWFRKHSQWDNYYRTWQFKANALSSQGKLQLSLQETQQMLDDAKERNNKLGRALAYKQIGVIYRMAKNGELQVEQWVMSELYDLADYYGFDDNGSVEASERDIKEILEKVFAGKIAEAQELIDKYTEYNYSLFGKKRQQKLNRNYVA